MIFIKQYILLIIIITLQISCKSKISIDYGIELEFKNCDIETQGLSSSSIEINFNTPKEHNEFMLLRDGEIIYHSSNMTIESFIDTSLREGQPYTYECHSINQHNKRAKDPKKAIGRTLVLTPPSFIGIQNTALLSYTSARLTWNQPEEGPYTEYYKVYEQLGSSIDFDNPQFIVTERDNFTLSGLTPNTQYSFAVRACNVNDICDTNTNLITRTTESDSVSPSIDEVTFQIEDNEDNLLSFGITKLTPGKAWKIKIVANDNSGVTDLKVYRKLSNIPNDFPLGNEEECQNNTHTNCLIGDSNTNTVISEFNDLNMGQQNLYANYRIEAGDIWGNKTVENRSYNAQYPLKVTTGYHHTCVTFNHGKSTCFGNNTYGQLGDGTNTSTNLSTERIGQRGYLEIINPTLDDGANKIESIQAVADRTCVILDNGRIKCWGRGVYMTRSIGALSFPYTATGCQGKIANWPARRHDDNFSSYSDYSYTILADDGVTNYAIPNDINSFEIHNSEIAKTYDGSEFFQCSLISESSASFADQLKCWGKSFNHSRTWTGNGNRYGFGHHQSGCLLGNGTRNYTWPVRSGADCGFLNYGYQINAHWNGCTNSNQLPLNNNFVSEIAGEKIESFSLGKYHACALYTNNRVYCWGGETAFVALTTSWATIENTTANLMLGIGGINYGLDKPESDKSVPILVEDPNSPGSYIDENVIKVASSATGSCALLVPITGSRNRIRCWGKNSNGELGQGNSLETSAKVSTVSRSDNALASVSSNISFGTENIVEIVGSKYKGSYCAISEEDNIFCWGENTNLGYLGNGGTENIGDNEPVSPNSRVDLNLATIDLSIGRDYMCALLYNGDMKCWGDNTYGKGGHIEANYLLSPSDTISADFGYVQ